MGLTYLILPTRYSPYDQKTVYHAPFDVFACQNDGRVPYFECTLKGTYDIEHKQLQVGNQKYMRVEKWMHPDGKRKLLSNKGRPPAIVEKQGAIDALIANWFQSGVKK